MHSVDIIQDLDLWLSGKQYVNGVLVDLTLKNLNKKLLDIIDGRDNVRIYSSMHTHQPGLISDEDLPVPVFVGFAESLTDGLSGEPFNRKERCVAATTANITLSGPQTIDDLPVIAGDRVLVKDQTTTSQNGIYQVNAGAWTRTADADTRDELVSAFVFIPHGSTQHRNTAWVCTIEAGTIGTATMVWNESFVIPQAMIPFPEKTDSTAYLRTLFTGAALRSAHKLGVMTPEYDPTVFRGTHFTLLFDQIPIASANSGHLQMLVKRYQSIAHFFDPGTEMYTYADYTIEQADSNDINNQIPWNNVGSLITLSNI